MYSVYLFPAFFFCSTQNLHTSCTAFLRAEIVVCGCVQSCAVKMVGKFQEIVEHRETPAGDAVRSEGFVSTSDTTGRRWSEQGFSNVPFLR